MSVNITEKQKEVELVEVSGDIPVAIPVTYTYSVTWKKTTAQRNTGALVASIFFPRTLEIHWLSIINSAVLVLLLTGFVVLILARMLNKDFARYSKVVRPPCALCFFLFFVFVLFFCFLFFYFCFFVLFLFPFFFFVFYTP